MKIKHIVYLLILLGIGAIIFYRISDNKKEKILIAILIIIAIPFVVALFVSKEYATERQITINKPETEVFSYIRQLKNQDNYSVWAMADPNMKTEFTGTDGTPGFIYAWDGNDKAGKGEQEIKGLTEG